MFSQPVPVPEVILPKLREGGDSALPQLHRHRFLKDVVSGQKRIKEAKSRPSEGERSQFVDSGGVGFGRRQGEGDGEKIAFIGVDGCLYALAVAFGLGFR